MLQLQSFEFSFEFSKKNWGFTANLILSLHHRSIMWVLNFISFIITYIFFLCLSLLPLFWINTWIQFWLQTQHYVVKIRKTSTVLPDMKKLTFCAKWTPIHPLTNLNGRSTTRKRLTKYFLQDTNHTINGFHPRSITHQWEKWIMER